MRFFAEYADAYRDAVTWARELGRPVGLCRVEDGFVLRLVPIDAARRFGWEARCEIVNPTDPLI